MHPLFHDLLFPCVTGSLDLSSKPALKIFICSNIRQTCTWINRKVDELCKEAFQNIYPGVGDVSKSFIYRWILSKPEIKPFQNFKVETSPAIFFKDTSIVVLNDVLHCGELSLELPKFTSIQLLEDYLILQFDEEFLALSLEEWIRTSTPTPQKLVELEGAKFIKSFNQQLLFYKPKASFCMLYVDNMELKVNECLTLGSDLIKICLSNGVQHVFHQRSQCTIFFFHQSFSHPLLGAVFTDELTPSETQTVILHDTEVFTGKLFTFNDTVLLCSLDKKRHLQMHRIDPKNNCIHTHPLELAGNPKKSFYNLINGEIHLDKIFLIATSTDGYNWADVHRYLIVIDIGSQTVEVFTQIDTDSYQKIAILASTLGKLLITSPDFCVDYT